MAKSAKKKPLTVAQIAARIGVSKATIYKTVRVAKQRDADPLKPLYDLAEQLRITRSIATSVVTIFKNDGIPALLEILNAGFFKETTRSRFAAALMSTREPAVREAIATAEKERKARRRSGVRAGMSKAKA